MIAHNIVLSLLYLFCVAKANSFLQLNGYKADGAFFRYFRTDFSAFAIVFFAVDIVFFVVFEGVWLYAHAALVILLAVKYVTEPKKTPLRLTWRMKRLFVAEWVTLLGLAFVFNPIVFVVLPFVAIFANAVNAPIEVTIQAGFVEKAKAKLKNYPNLKVVGITGSYAKTSVKNVLTDMLSKEYKVVKTPGSFNTPMGIAKTINQTDFDGVDFFVCEMGARRQGEIAELCGIVRPDVSVVTGISSQHLQTFGNIDNVLKTKFEIFAGTKNDGVVVVNDDCKYLKDLPDISQKVYRSGQNENCDLSYADVTCSKEGVSFGLISEGINLPCKTKLLGAHNVSNVCLCALVGQILGLKWQSIVDAVIDLQYSPHRLELITGQNGLYILDDSYNANPDGVLHALEVLSCFDGKKFVIMSGVVDCGKSHEEINVKIGEQMASCCDFALLVGINSKSIMQGLLQKGFDQDKIFCCDGIDGAVKKAAEYAVPNDVILFCNDLPDNIV